MKILNKEILTKIQGTKVTKMEIEAPLIAGKAKPGQFVVLMVKEEGERIPLTVVSADAKKGAVTIIFQELGFTTKLLGKVKIGESLYSFVGPLGHATEIKKYGDVILVGGGVGIAEIYPVAKAMKEAGNRVITIIGARTKELLILEKELKAASDELHIVTDDGSYGKKGFTTDILRVSLRGRSEATDEAIPKDEIASRPSGARNDGAEAAIRKPKTANFVYAVGPIPMMQKVAEVTKVSGVKTVVSLNALMVDGTGMCGSCRVTVGGKVKFSCVDGPEFDAHEVDWKELTARSKIYCDKEEHICKLTSKTA